MTQRINVPGMGVVEFPDGMSDLEISAVIRRSTVNPAASQEFKPDAVGMGEAALIAAGRGTDMVGGGSPDWDVDPKPNVTGARLR